MHLLNEALAAAAHLADQHQRRVKMKLHVIRISGDPHVAALLGGLPTDQVAVQTASATGTLYHQPTFQLSGGADGDAIETGTSITVTAYPEQSDRREQAIILAGARHPAPR